MASDCRTFHRSIGLLRIVRTTCRGWHRRCFLSGKLSNYPTTKCWNQGDPLQKKPMGAFYQFSHPGSNNRRRKNDGKTMVSEAIFFDTKTNCRDIILCTFGAKSGPRVFRGLKTSKNQPFGPTRPIHPQISPNSIKEVYYDVYCFKVANFISGWPFKTAPQKKTGRPS